jgi:hypothetical protein
MQPVTIPLQLAIIHHMDQHFKPQPTTQDERPQQLAVQDHQLQQTYDDVKKQCNDIYRPPRDHRPSNLFVFSETPGIGKTELLSEIVKSQKGKNIIFAKSGSGEEGIHSIARVSPTERFIDLYVDSVVSSGEDYGAVLYQLYCDIATLLKKHDNGKDTVVIIDPKEFGPNSHLRTFGTHFATRQPLHVIQAYGLVYERLATEFPAAFFISAHSSLNFSNFDQHQGKSPVRQPDQHNHTSLVTFPGIEFDATTMEVVCRKMFENVKQ